jgi:hypothetical protein
MLSSAKVCKTLRLIFERKGIVNDSSATLASYAQTNQNSHCWQVSLHEVWCAIKGIDPDDRVLSVEGFEEFALYLVSAVCFFKAVVDEILSLGVVLVKELSWDKFFKRFAYLVRLYGGLHIFNWLFWLLSLNS